MKEYEYIIKGIDGFLVDQLVGVICQENLERRHYPDGFRRIFDNYRLLRESYAEKRMQFGSADFSEAAMDPIISEYEKRRNWYLQSFIEDIDANYPELNVIRMVEEYFHAMNEQDVITVEKRVCVFPYIVSQVRLYEEGQ